MGQTADELRSELDRKRADLTRDVDRIEDKVRSTFDLRQQVEANPLPMTGLAIAAGFVLGNVVGGRHHEEPPQRYADSRYGTASLGGLAPGAASPAGSIYSREVSHQPPHEQNDGPGFFSAMGEGVKEGFRRGAGGNSFESTLSNLSAAMLAMLLDKAKDALDSNLPGFAEKFEQVAESTYSSGARSTAPPAGQANRRPAETGSPATTTSHRPASTTDQPRATYPASSSTSPN